MREYTFKQYIFTIRKLVRYFIYIVCMSSILLYVALLFSFHYIQIIETQGVSMEDTLFNGNQLLIFKTNNINDIQTGDIIVFIKNGKNYIKRVIAKENDTISILNNKIYINNTELIENYIKDSMMTNNIESIKIPKGNIFVMGDNRNNSEDSRRNIIGLVDVQRELQGKVIFNLTTNKISLEQITIILRRIVIGLIIILTIDWFIMGEDQYN